jgi:hypothetical protein
MATTDTVTVSLGDGSTLALAIEQTGADRTVARLERAGRRFEVVATRDEGADGEVPTWQAEVVELAGAGAEVGHPFAWEATNVGYATAADALAETARHIVENVEGGPSPA